MELSRNFLLPFTLLFAAALPVAGFAAEVVAEPVSPAGTSSGKESLKEKAAHVWDRSGEAAEKGWDKTKEVSKEGWDKTTEVSAETWDKTKDVSGKAWDKTKEATEDAADFVKGETHAQPADESGVVVEEKSVAE